MRIPIAAAAAALAAIVVAAFGCRQTDVVARTCTNAQPCRTSTVDGGGACPDRPAVPATATTGVGRFFGQAACACAGLSAGSRWQVDAFDSADGPYTGPSGPGGNVSVNERLAADARFEVSGNVTVAEALQAGTASVTVGGSLATGGPVNADGALEIAGNAVVGGDLRAGALSVGGRLTQPPGATRAVAGAEAIAAIEIATVTVAPPCDCAAPPDLAMIATDGQMQATNDPTALASISGLETVSLTCGVYGYDSIAGGALELELSGPTVIFVARDVSLDRLDVALSTGATLDLFVGGGWRIGGPSALGARERPASLRIFIGTNGTVDLEGDTALFGQLLAPAAEVVIANGLELHGSAFARRFSGTGPVVIHHDRSFDP